MWKIHRISSLLTLCCGGLVRLYRRERLAFQSVSRSHRLRYIRVLIFSLFLVTSMSAGISFHNSGADGRSAQIVKYIPDVDTPTATFHPYFSTPTAAPTVDTSCQGGLPVGWGSVTPDAAWLSYCRSCVNQGLTQGAMTATATASNTPTMTATLEPGVFNRSWNFQEGEGDGWALTAAYEATPGYACGPFGSWESGSGWVTTYGLECPPDGYSRRQSRVEYLFSDTVTLTSVIAHYVFVAGVHTGYSSCNNGARIKVSTTVSEVDWSTVALQECYDQGTGFDGNLIATSGMANIRRLILECYPGISSETEDPGGDCSIVSVNVVGYGAGAPNTATPAGPTATVGVTSTPNTGPFCGSVIPAGGYGGDAFSFGDLIHIPQILAGEEQCTHFDSVIWDLTAIGQGEVTIPELTICLIPILFSGTLGIAGFALDINLLVYLFAGFTLWRYWRQGS